MSVWVFAMISTRLDGKSSTNPQLGGVDLAFGADRSDSCQGQQLLVDSNPISYAWTGSIASSLPVPFVRPSRD